ncbi:MAG: type II toxin-antitoxin system VapC family toxin [Actinomycetota bacterium]|nr:type II toxin-antitoxin system VapC family toxin [Actinomycetota bacterium]MDQ3648060.1 type II toxin-antitoxin system VapC family toxin [Actinomycetota bacterium]
MSKATILDASALLAVVGDEPGGELVAPLLDGAVISTVNWSEVLARYVDLGLETAGREEEIESLGVSLAPFTPRQSEIAAGLLPFIRKAGLSLGDRACLALALDLGGQPVTADRAWERIDVGLDVTLIR